MYFDLDDAKTLRRLLIWRRDVRHFLSDSVDEAQVQRLQDAMERAPSVGNSRPWRVIRVEDPDLRAAVRADFERCNAEAAERYEDSRRAAYKSLKLAGLETAPVQLAVFTDIDPSEGHGLGRRTMPQTLHQSTAMAIHTLWLAARVENLGLGMVSILDPRAMERLFKAPARWEFAAYLCIGHAVFDDDTPLLQRRGWQASKHTVWQRR